MGHKRLRFLGVVAAAMVFTLACGGTTGGGTPTKTYKIGLVTDIGGLNDKSFNHLADVGLEKAKTDFKIQADVKESKSGDDYVPNLTDFATKNYDLVIGVGFLMQEAVGTVSGQFPNIHFAIIDGAGTDSKGTDLKHANVQSLFFKEQDAGAMVGVIAGWLEKNNKAKKNKHVVRGGRHQHPARQPLHRRLQVGGEDGRPVDPGARRVLQQLHRPGQVCGRRDEPDQPGR